MSVSAAEPTDKSLEIMRKFSEQYASRTDTFFCSDLSVTAVVIKVSLHLTVQVLRRGKKLLFADRKDTEAPCHLACFDLVSRLAAS